VYPVEDHSNWMELYPDAGEEIPKNLPPEKGSRFRMTVYADADHAHDLFTRRSITESMMRFAYIKSEDNDSDMMKKPCNEKFHYLMKRWLFRVP
jgi:hypothetical protein